MIPSWSVIKLKEFHQGHFQYIFFFNAFTNSSSLGQLIILCNQALVHSFCFNLDVWYKLTRLIRIECKSTKNLQKHVHNGSTIVWVVYAKYYHFSACMWNAETPWPRVLVRSLETRGGAKGSTVYHHWIFILFLL